MGLVIVELPNLVYPISLIIDDGMPIVTPRRCADIVNGNCAEKNDVDPWDIMDGLLSLTAEFGVKGKLSLVPYRKELGMIDMLTDPVIKEHLSDFTAVIREKVMPHYDITPEIISHGPVIDIVTDLPIARQYTEKDGVDSTVRPELLNEARWSQTQDEDTLEKYIGRALTALKNVGVIANGVTSPWDFGIANEAAYSRAVGNALRRVNDISGGWYFLHTPTNDDLSPRLQSFEWSSGSYVVSIMASGHMVDMTVAERVGPDPDRQADVYLSADGAAGAMADLIHGKSPVILCGHWQCLEKGLAVYREVFRRLALHHGAKVQWMTCSSIARYFAAAKTFRVARSNGGDILLESAIECPDFTIRMPMDRAVRQLMIHGVVLERDDNSGYLANGKWRQTDGVLYICFDLKKRTVISVQFEGQ
ncbi:MAG: hypothetical protein AABZ39_02275 [Spirochaetota bacterium]